MLMSPNISFMAIFHITFLYIGIFGLLIAPHIGDNFRTGTSKNGFTAQEHALGTPYGESKPGSSPKSNLLVTQPDFGEATQDAFIADRNSLGRHI